MSAADMDAIALVRGLRHRVSRSHTCRCEECRALVRVATLAKEAVEMKRAKRAAKIRRVREGLNR